MRKDRHSTVSVEAADVVDTNMQYLYADGDTCSMLGLIFHNWTDIPVSSPVLSIQAINVGKTMLPGLLQSTAWAQ